MEGERSPLVEVAPAKAREAGALEEVAPATAGELGARSWSPCSYCNEPRNSVLPPHGGGGDARDKEAAVPTTPPHALLATPCPPSSGKRGPSPSRSSASPGSSGGRLSAIIDAEGFQVVVCRRGTKERSREKDPKKARGRERGRSL